MLTGGDRNCLLTTASRAVVDISSVASLSAVGVTNQRETTVVWDKETGEPLYNAIGRYVMHRRDQVSLPNVMTIRFEKIEMPIKCIRSY